MLLFRSLLYLYPASWRAEYGKEMCADFRSRLAMASGFFEKLLLWLEAIADAIWSAPVVQFDLLRQDLRYGLRTLRRSPGFSLTAVAIAATGIGATTAAFTMVDHVLIRPLPFPHQERLVNLYEGHVKLPGEWEASPANYRDWKRMSTSFEAMAAYRGLALNLSGQGEPRHVEGASLTYDVFAMLGAQPMLGRGFNAQDDRDSAPGTVILSYGMWQTQFGGDQGVIGRTIDLDLAPYTIIGVMPKGFAFPNRKADIWTPMRWAPAAFEDRTDTYIRPIGLLNAGTTLQQAQAEMGTIGSQLARAYPKELEATTIKLHALRDEISGQAMLMLKVLLGAALCVLLIACTNLANLLLARALVRGRELAVRAALGAGRERLIRQMLTESLLLAFAGGALGLILAYAALPMLVRLVPLSLPIAELPPIDGRVLLFAMLITCVTGIGFGLVPALRLGRNVGASELQGGRSAMGGRRERLRSALVIAEVAGTIVLLVGFGLLTRALWRVQSINPGFRADHVLTLRTSLPMPRYEREETRDPFYRHVLTETARLPGVRSAAYTSFLPMIMGGGIWPVEIVGRPESLANRRTVSLRFVTPGFFQTMGIPLLQGRDIRESDRHDAPWVTVVSQSFVARYWAGENPIGRHISLASHDRLVIGVAGDVKVRGLERNSEPQVYLSWLQPDDVSPWYAPKDLVIRTTTGDPMALVPALRRIIHEADAAQPVSDVLSLGEIVDAETASRRVQLYTLGTFATIAFLLAAVGIHGILSFAVTTRTSEIGVRIALGATPRDIMALTLRDGFWLAGAGIVAGVVLALAGARVLGSLLAGVQPDDAPTFAAACLLALAMTLVGGLLPTLRAIHIDPTTAMRAE